MDVPHKTARTVWARQGALLFLCMLARTVPAQPLRTLQSPNAVLAHDYSQVRGVMELRDGRVIVTDRIEERVSVADFATGRLQPIGRTGRGPAEYRLPTALMQLPGDSVLLIDEGNSRFEVIGPDLRIHRSFTLRIPGIPTPVGARGVDGRGRYYIQIPGWLSNARARGDSVWLVRFDPAVARLDTLALLKGATSPPPRDGRQMGIPFVPFSAQDTWAVSRDGRVAIVRSNDYHVEWHQNDGTVRLGATVKFAPVPVTLRDRILFTRSFLANSPIGGRDPNGGMSATPAEFLSDRNVRQMAEQNAFATVMGPFTESIPLLGPDGALWVERSVATGSPATWDVFDATGRLASQVQLPAGRRLVALGRGVAYLVVADDDGVEKLERYTLGGT